MQMVERLFKKNASEVLNRNCTDYFDRTALTLAVTNRRERMIEYLLNAGVRTFVIYSFRNDHSREQ